MEVLLPQSCCSCRQGCSSRGIHSPKSFVVVVTITQSFTSKNSSKGTPQVVFRRRPSWYRIQTQFVVEWERRRWTGTGVPRIPKCCPQRHFLVLLARSDGHNNIVVCWYSVCVICITVWVLVLVAQISRASWRVGHSESPPAARPPCQ